MGSCSHRVVKFSLYPCQTPPQQVTQFASRPLLRLILESPSRGRIFALRNDHIIIGMVNLLFTISTAEGGMVILLEDFIVHPNHRGQGYGEALLDFVHKFAKDKQFKRVTLLTDKFSPESQKFFAAHGYNRSDMVPMRKSVE